MERPQPPQPFDNEPTRPTAFSHGLEARLTPEQAYLEPATAELRHNIEAAMLSVKPDPLQPSRRTLSKKANNDETIIAASNGVVENPFTLHLAVDMQPKDGVVATLTLTEILPLKAEAHQVARSTKAPQPKRVYTRYYLVEVPDQHNATHTVITKFIEADQVRRGSFDPDATEEAKWFEASNNLNVPSEPEINWLTRVVGAL